jgi:glycosyltransferase involved in cell wall biosynthesis
MNVALFASAFAPHVGGVEEHVRQLARAGRAKGISPIVITNRWPPELAEHEEIGGVPVYRFPLRMPEGSVRQQIKYQLTYTRTLRRMISVFKKHEINLLHVHCVSSNGYYANIVHTKLGIPLILTTHGERTMDAGQIYQRSPLINKVLRSLTKNADYITACSAHTLADLENWYGEPFGDRANPVSNGINLLDYREYRPYRHPKPYILGIGRLVPQKGFDILIRAFERLEDKSHDLLIVGEGSERVGLEQLAERSSARDRVRFLGIADHETAVSLFQGCAFFVLPSRQEPQGIVNLEAMASGKAVVASHVGGVPELVVDGETGLLVPAEDDAAMAAAMTRLIRDQALTQRLGCAGRARAENFDWTVVADRYLAIYRASLATPDRSADGDRGKGGRSQ